MGMKQRDARLKKIGDLERDMNEAVELFLAINLMAAAAIITASVCWEF